MFPRIQTDDVLYSANWKIRTKKTLYLDIFQVVYYISVHDLNPRNTVNFSNIFIYRPGMRNIDQGKSFMSALISAKSRRFLE